MPTWVALVLGQRALAARRRCEGRSRPCRGVVARVGRASARGLARMHLDERPCPRRSSRSSCRRGRAPSYCGGSRGPSRERARPGCGGRDGPWPSSTQSRHVERLSREPGASRPSRSPRTARAAPARVVPCTRAPATSRHQVSALLARVAQAREGLSVEPALAHVGHLVFDAGLVLGRADTRRVDEDAARLHVVEERGRRALG